jgi:ATP-dependent DNA ligase
MGLFPNAEDYTLSQKSGLVLGKACEFGLENLVSKHRDRAYRAGTSPNWVKVKNPKHPAMARVKEAFSKP